MKVCQRLRILSHLRRHSITPLQALRLYGCFNLAARIYDLKRDGHRISAKLVRKGSARVAEYRLA